MREGRDPPGVYRWGFSYRDVSVFSPGSIDLLVPRLLQASHYHPSRLGGVDDVVDHGPAGGDVRTDLRANGLDHPRPCLLWVVRSFDLLVEDDVDRAFGPHDRDLGERPSNEHIGLIALAAHHVVTGAVCLPHDDGDLRHGRL